MTTIPVFHTEEKSHVDPTIEDSITHWWCCEDPDLLMCGMSGKGMEFDDSVDVECTGCAVAHERAECPKWGRCPTDVDNLN